MAIIANIAKFSSPKNPSAKIEISIQPEITNPEEFRRRHTKWFGYDV
jgi:hypothetical protein